MVCTDILVSRFTCSTDNLRASRFERKISPTVLPSVFTGFPFSRTSVMRKSDHGGAAESTAGKELQGLEQFPVLELQARPALALARDHLGFGLGQKPLVTEFSRDVAQLPGD